MAATERHSRAPEIHPEVLQSVELRLRPTAGEPVVLETKVLDVESEDGATILVVACPPGLDPLEHHFDALVSWTYPLGRIEWAVTTAPARRSYGPVWLVRPVGAPSRLQLRQYFRAAVQVAVWLTWSTADEVTHHATGVVVDLSEGGLLAVLKGELPAAGTAVEAHLGLDDKNVVQPATVIRHVDFAGGGSGVALAFREPVAGSDRIRRAVFAAERRARRGLSTRLISRGAR